MEDDSIDSAFWFKTNGNCTFKISKLLQINPTQNHFETRIGVGRYSFGEFIAMVKPKINYSFGPEFVIHFCYSKYLKIVLVFSDV